MNKKIEILAPVGNKEMLKTAIAYRADAVYFGLENFNARAKADNFNSDNISLWGLWRSLFFWVN